MGKEVKEMTFTNDIGSKFKLAYTEDAYEEALDEARENGAKEVKLDTGEVVKL